MCCRPWESAYAHNSIFYICTGRARFPSLEAPDISIYVFNQLQSKLSSGPVTPVVRATQTPHRQWKFYTVAEPDVGSRQLAREEPLGEESQQGPLDCSRMPKEARLSPFDLALPIVRARAGPSGSQSAARFLSTKPEPHRKGGLSVWDFICKCCNTRPPKSQRSKLFPKQYPTLPASKLSEESKIVRLTREWIF
jgi:hypothetical protein